MQLRKCDPLGPVDRPNLHHYPLLKEILLKKVQRRKCDPLGPFDNLHNYISINRNFTQKSGTKKVWPFGSSRQTKPSQLLPIEILQKNVRRRKCDPMGPVDRLSLYYYILIKILLEKVWRRKCDSLVPVARPNLHNHMLKEILLKKVWRRKCDPLGPVDRPNR